ncbi:hypothetical protein [Aurantiacibacter aquimixticola]|uniref:HEAT repeat domain-containing protein n=1 Tax=Aurantiacibacter aquimixticola TaxID=1958945 RepID=A0A419RQD2_9SPHN|nr:hypothetical protein [Aurantiacibacter aquimixticola]RJY07989.1 hypothetical protein D6201_00240 [Aurantiacibacter aquimixticola]
MDVHPFIAALRSDRAPQRQAQAAMDAARLAWREEPGASEAMEDLRRYGAGAPIEACATLESIFTAGDEASRLMGLLSEHFCAAIVANPIGHPPFRNGFDGNAASILLARSGRAQLMIQSRDPGRFDIATYAFSDAVRYDAVLAGKATARLVHASQLTGRALRFSTQKLDLAGGGRFAVDLATEALVVDEVERRLVTLRLLREDAEPQPSRVHDADTGALLHRSAARIASSRREAIVALLGRMGRADAAPQMAQIALGGEDSSLRWQALRECIALDTSCGFTALTTIARRGDDPLCANAGALRAQLLETHPELLELEASQCPV